MPTDRFVVLSIYPRYANKILSGEKRLEFRKSWGALNGAAFVIYATAPIQKIVGIAHIKKVHQGSPTTLWRLARDMGGGVSRRVLYEYFRGRPGGFAIEIESVQPCLHPLNPGEFLPDFNAPQSFTYIDRTTFNRIESAIEKQPPKGRLILIAGVHGVGKTTLCSRLADGRNFVHKSASQLIREEKDAAIDINTKIVADIAGNQQLLIDAVSRTTKSGQTLLLDGHFSLLNIARKVKPVATKVFVDLGINGIILIIGKPGQILSQIIKRDGKGFSVDEIRTLQTMEISRAKSVSDELGVPLIRVKAFDCSAFTKAVRTLARNPDNRLKNKRV